MSAPAITLSIVSHRQNALVNQLLEDLERHCRTPLMIVLTQNVPDDVAFVAGASEVIVNPAPKGFGANHNAAFRRCTTEIFCVLNPDVRLAADPFPELIRTLAQPGTGLVAPLVRSPTGVIEDSARRFPSPPGLLAKGLDKLLGRAPRKDYEPAPIPFEVDWVAGMFMLLRSDTFAQLNGFDERYHLYYEDVELCARVRLEGLAIVVHPAVRVTHDARRDSHRRPLYAWWHLRSIARWLLSDTRRRLLTTKSRCARR